MQIRSLIMWGSVIAIALAAPMIASRAVSGFAEKEWTQVQAEAARAKVPLNLDQVLKDYPSVPDEQNAAEGAKTYLRAVLAEPRRGAPNEFQGPLKDNLKAATERIDQEMRKGPKANLDRMGRALKLFEPRLSQLQTELEKPEWNFKRSWQEGMALLFPDPARLKEVNKLLAAKAMVAWRTNPSESAGAIRSMIKLGDHLESEPHNICILVGINCRSVAYRTALNLAIAPNTPDDKRKLLLDAVQAPNKKIDWRLAWRIEHASTLACLDLVTSKKGFYELGLKTDEMPMRSMRAMYQAKAAIARLMIEAESTLASGPNDTKTMRQVAGTYYLQIQDILGDYHDVFAKLSSGSDSFSYAVDAVDANEALRRMTYLAIQMAGNPPAAKLPADAMRPEWLDPFSGKPLRVKRSGNGFVLYSVGPNRIDDGASVVQDSSGRRSDVVVKVWPTVATIP